MGFPMNVFPVDIVMQYNAGESMPFSLVDQYKFSSWLGREDMNRSISLLSNGMASIPLTEAKRNLVKQLTSVMYQDDMIHAVSTLVGRSGQGWNQNIVQYRYPNGSFHW
jgi:hypothetical protein